MGDPVVLGRRAKALPTDRWSDGHALLGSCLVAIEMGFERTRRIFHPHRAMVTNALLQMLHFILHASWLDALKPRWYFVYVQSSTHKRPTRERSKPITI